MNNEIAENIIEYFSKNGKPVTLDSDLFREGVLDSLELLDLVEYLEDMYKVEVSQEYLSIENFSSVECISSLIDRIQK